MVGFIDDHRDCFGIEPICAVLPIAPSTYFLRQAQHQDATTRSAPARRDDELRAAIQRIWDANFQVYGPRKVWKELRRAGQRVARCTVECVMRAMGLRGVSRGRAWVITTRTEAATDRPADLVDRRFTATRPNELWVADFTYVATWRGFVYVAFVIDVFARRIVGWRVAASLQTDFVLDAVIGLSKTEVIQRKGPWRHLEAVEFATLTWEDWFNMRRLLEPIGYVPPAEYEAHYYAQTSRGALVGSLIPTPRLMPPPTSACRTFFDHR